jgi:Glycosyl hydrolases family 2, TIM barrel domain/Glycosyl hydrolases family 2, sugar binding domain/Glycosyl hydrolases family 2
MQIQRPKRIRGNFPGIFLILFAALTAIFPAHSQPTQVQYLSGLDKDNTVPWDFMLTGAGRKVNVQTTIPVPSCWELMGFGVYQYGGNPNGETGHYSHQFAIPASWAGKKIFLVFEGVFTDTAAKINGQSAGPAHQGGFYEFKYDVTDKVVPGANTNVLEVTVSKWSASVNIARSEQQGLDYWDFGGIYRPVYLEAKPAAYIEHIAANPLADGNITVKADLGGSYNNYSVKAFVTDATGKPLGSSFSNPVASGESNVVLSASLPQPNPWSAEFPTLYTVTVQLLDANKAVVHSVTNQIGFRTVTFVKNRGFFINGKKVVMRGVARHEEWPTSGRTTSRAVSILDITMMKEANFNAVRMSHYPPNKIFLEECDRLGLYVLDEFDSYQHHGDQGGNGPMDITNGVRLIEEMIRRDVNHPSIIAWDNGNEGGANPNLDGDNGRTTNYFGIFDLQKRMVVRPQQGGQVFNGLITDHYEYYASISGNYLRPGAQNVFMPTEMIHSLYDGGGGACLAEIWNLFLTAPNSGGMFVWSWDDEGIRHDDTGVMDVSGQSAPDGIVGPFREKEASYYTYKAIFSPVQIDAPDPANFTGTLAVSNRYNFTSLDQCTFHWQLGFYPDAADSTSAFSTNALTGGLRVVVDGGNFKGPSIVAGGTGSLVLPKFPGDGNKYDALRLTATDPLGNNIYTWTWPLHMPAQIRDRILGAVSSSAPAINATADANEISITNGSRVFRFSKTTGTLDSVTVSNLPVSFSNGPRPVAGGDWEVSGVTNYFDGANYVIQINNLTDATNGFQWTLRPDGWLKLSYRYTLTGAQSFMGITFDYPADQVTGMNWLGQGPYRVWKNRIAGQEIFGHTKAFNDTWTGQSTNYAARHGTPTKSQWVYPEFAGYHGQFYWATLQTTEQPITVVTPTSGLFFRVLTPPKTDDNNVNPTFPPGTISLLHGITPMGAKFDAAAKIGPSGAMNIATGTYTGEADFFFGVPPHSSVPSASRRLNTKNAGFGQSSAIIRENE